MAKLLEKDDIIIEVEGEEIPKDSEGWKNAQMLVDYLAQSDRFDLRSATMVVSKIGYTELNIKVFVEYFAI